MQLAREGARRLPEDERRANILAAAERAFVAYGFHAATMSQVAEEAGMSAGNLYRYFPSKEALVEGMCHAGQVERTASFSELANAPDLGAAMRQAMQWHKHRAQDAALLWLRTLVRNAAANLEATRA